MEHIDVIIVGAGLSGIGAACQLREKSPHQTFSILESRSQLGGTWDLFRYPGIRSDSDMHTLGYRFKPWVADKAIAEGPAILQYIQETAKEYDILRHIRFHHRLVRADWCSKTAQWCLDIENPKTGKSSQLSCSFLFMCAGYYSYRQGHQPHIPGLHRFDGPVIHPQKWPEDLDYAAQRIAIIGSGATAVTLLPALSDSASHVTMVQRSPSYILSWPEKDLIANILRRLLPSGMAYRFTRWKNINMQQFLYRQSRRRPEWVKRKLAKRARKALGPTFDIDTHLSPKYNPWDERMCLAPNGDFFDAIRNGRASIATGVIKTVTENGLELQSGQTIGADIIVTATGLNLVTLGEAEFVVDGQAVDFSQTLTYRGLAYSDVPNLCASFGYVNASWTLRSDLIAQYVCRLLNHMKASRKRQCVPRLRPEDQHMERRPFIDAFSPGYIRRIQDQFPKQGAHPPWTNPQDYALDKVALTQSPIDDGVMTFS